MDKNNKGGACVKNKDHEIHDIVISKLTIRTVYTRSTKVSQ